MFSLPIAKRDSQGCLWCTKCTALGLNIERVFGVTVYGHQCWSCNVATYVYVNTFNLRITIRNYPMSILADVVEREGALAVDEQIECERDK